MVANPHRPVRRRLAHTAYDALARGFDAYPARGATEDVSAGIDRIGQELRHCAESPGNGQMTTRPSLPSRTLGKAMFS